MQSLYFGRGIALVVIAGIVGWTASVLLARGLPKPPKYHSPRQPLMRRWPPPRASKPRFLPEAAFGASRPSSNISREFLR